MANTLLLKMILDSWHARIKETDALLEKITDANLMKEVTPNRNRGVYILGHLIAVHDRMLPLLGFGEQRYPQLTEAFLSNPDKIKELPATIAELREYWKNINTLLAGHFINLSEADWLDRHNSVSPENFVKEPHRNKLNVIISRTVHVSYHQGQLALLNEG
jgi:hypothetical protein